MFTIKQIHRAHAKVKTGADFPHYIKELKELGLQHYTNYVGDGHTIYYGSNDYCITGPAKYPEMEVATQSSPETLKTVIREHQQGKTDYPTVCRQAAEAGVEKWTVDLTEMTCTYYDRTDTAMIVETIPAV